MLILAKVFVWLSILWAAVALTAQVIVARGGGRRDYSRRSGSPLKGLLYSFSAAMIPAQKETVRLHPGKFAVGLLMHAGVAASLLGVVLVLVHPVSGHEFLSLVRPPVAISLVAGIYLFLRRLLSVTLRAMSTPEDYISILATCVLLAMASVQPVEEEDQLGFLIYAGVFLVYLPLGKLRHAVFFFVARGDHGRRLGYRGVYPPASARIGQPHGK